MDETGADQIFSIPELAQKKYGKDSPQYQVFMQTFKNAGLALKSYSQLLRFRGDVFGAHGAAGITLGVAAEKGLDSGVVQGAFNVGKELIGQAPEIGPKIVGFLQQHIQPEQVPALIVIGGGMLIAGGAVDLIGSKVVKGEIGERAQIAAGKMTVRLHEKLQQMKTRLQPAPKTL